MDKRGRRDHQIYSARTPRLSASCHYGGVDLTVSTRTTGLEGKGVNINLKALETILAACSLELIGSGVAAR